jgi:hypothetical protein
MKRTVWITSGVTALVLLLAGASFVGGRLLGDEGRTGNGQEFIISSSGEQNKVLGVIEEIQRADELPEAPADMLGSFVRREDNRVFIRPFGIEEGGPETELVITHDTLIYQDVTANQFTDGVADEPRQQVLDRVALDGIGPGSIIRVWGAKRGDRVIAELIMFNVPVMIQR